MGTSVTPGGLAYSVVGSGPPLLWLSGYVVAHRAVEQYVALFADHYTCVVFDARGSGSTPASHFPRTTGAMALDALEVLRESGHESAHIHGISLGGMVAQELAIIAPHRVRTLVLGATSAGGFSSTPASLRFTRSNLCASRRAFSGLGRVSWRGAFNQAWAASRHDATSRLSRIAAPTLVLHGTSDTLLPVGNAQTLAGLLPGADLRLLEGVGHFYPEQAPKQSADLVRSWLERHGEVGPGPRPSNADALCDATAAPLRAFRNEVLPWRHVYRAWRPR